MYVLYSPRPIVADVNKSHVTMLQYNPHFNQSTQEPDEIVMVSDYDEGKILACLSRYSERRTFTKADTGFWIGNMELQIVLDTGKESKILLLGNLNYSYESYGKPKYKILDADNLIPALLEMLNIETTG